MARRAVGWFLGAAFMVGLPTHPARAESDGFMCATAMSGPLPAPIEITPQMLQELRSMPTRKQSAAFDIVIVPGPDLQANPAALAAFERAAQKWEAVIHDPIVVTINADFTDLGDPNTIGQASPVLLTFDFDVVRGAMAYDASSDVDNAIDAFLPKLTELSTSVPTGITAGTGISGTKANLKALGFPNLDTDWGARDSTIRFNSHFLLPFDLDNSDGVSPGTIDLESNAIHEIGHALGFSSTLDRIEVLGAGTYSLFPLDLFRFANGTAADPENASQFTSFARDLMLGGDPIFDDVTSEFRMSTGVTGDGRQASHWKDDLLTGVYIGAMDPSLSSGKIQPITDADLRALDLIGYDISVVPPPTPTPSPTASPSPTPTPTGTPTPTPSATPTGTPTPTPTPSATPTRTPTPAPTPSPTPMPTASPSPSPTPRERTRDDYDGDLKADVAVYETATGNWYAIGSTVGPLQLLGFGGGSGGLPAPYDPDGDGITNAGFVDFAMGDIFPGTLAPPTVTAPPLLESTTRSDKAEALGDGVHAPVADYDGDGKDDKCFYLETGGAWLVTSSIDGSSINFLFGGPGLVPVSADYDGDGKADFALYEAATGTWKILLSEAVTESDVVFGGGSRFVPVPADYDGDGKADLALYQKKKGKWRFRLSSTGTTSSFTGIGGTGWVATPGDFDGDGKVDAGAYRKSTGGWRYLSSSMGVKTNLPMLGGPGFVPVTGVRP